MEERHNPTSDGTSFLTRVRQSLAELHPAERRLGDLLCDFPGELASYSASELARLAGVSKATVSRFVRRLGYDSYEEARRRARDERETGSRLYLAASGEGGSSEPLLALAERAAENVRRTFATIDPTDLDEMAQAILTARKVWVVGFRASQPFAAYMQWQLTQVIDQVTAVPGAGQTMGEYLASLEPDDLAFVFALRRRVAQTEALLAEIERVSARLLLVTDEGMPLRSGATWHLRCETQSRGPLFNHVAVMGVCHLIANRAIELAGEAGVDRLHRIELMNDSLGEL